MSISIDALFIICSVAAPLTALTSTKVPFIWRDQTTESFTQLKTRFSSAPILIIPDLSLQFVVEEVDASEKEGGAILTQRSPTDNKLHPCAYFSHCLSQVEQNYNIGNREVLAVKLAFEEW